MKPSVLLREYRPQDEDVAIRLLVSKLPPAKQEAAYEPRRRRWRWQYYMNPNIDAGRPAIFVADVDGDFGGMVCTVPVRVRTMQGIVSGSWGMDFIVNPGIRGGGIGKQLLLEWIKRYAVSAVLGYTPVSLRVAKSVGFQELRAGVTVNIVLSRCRLALGLARERSRKDISRLGARWWRLNRRGRRDASFEVECSPEPDPKVPELWHEVAGKYKFCVDRDMAYLHWRFCAHPHHKYTFIHLKRRGFLCACAVVRLESGPYRHGVVSELIVDPQQADVVRALIQEAVAHCDSLHAASVTMDLPVVLLPEVTLHYPCSLVNHLGMIAYTSDPGLVAEGAQRSDSWLISRADADQDY